MFYGAGIRTFVTVLIAIGPLASGGLAGGCVSTLLNRRFHLQGLRTRLYPNVNNAMGLYAIRTETPEGRYWVQRVGYEPTDADKHFVDARMGFIFGLIEFAELKEARVLRNNLLNNRGHRDGTSTEDVTTDLTPEYKAVLDCLSTLHKKLKLS
jgi:hypothetical protein